MYVLGLLMTKSLVLVTFCLYDYDHLEFEVDDISYSWLQTSYGSSSAI